MAINIGWIARENIMSEIARAMINTSVASIFFRLRKMTTMTRRLRKKLTSTAMETTISDWRSDLQNVVKRLRRNIWIPERVLCIIWSKGASTDLWNINGVGGGVGGNRQQSRKSCYKILLIINSLFLIFCHKIKRVAFYNILRIYIVCHLHLPINRI